jgi:hypothetical protein
MIELHYFSIQICHSERSEESRNYRKKKILHFVQNDINNVVFQLRNGITPD